MGVGAKTKGYIKNNKTGVLKKFQYNPPELGVSRGATFVEIVSPGLSYPLVQYVHGNSRDFSIDLYLHDCPYTGAILSFIKFLEGMMPPETNSNYVKPPVLTFCWGFFIRKCVIVTLDQKFTLMDSSMRPLEATVTLSLKQVGV